MISMHGSMQPFIMSNHIGMRMSAICLTVFLSS